MAWIESHQKLEKSGKLIILSDILGINRYQAIGHLHSLWWWALDNACNGDVTRYRNALVTIIGLDEVQKNTYAGHQNVDWYDPEKVVNAFISSGFIDEIDGKLMIHDWENYTWRYFKIIEDQHKKRKQVRERVKRFRSNANVTHDVTQMKRNVTHLTKPNQTIPNKDLHDAKDASSHLNSTPKKTTRRLKNIKIIETLNSVFKTGLAQKFGESPQFNKGAASKGFANLLKSYEPLEIQKRIGYWFQSDLNYFVRVGYRVEIFIQHFNQLKEGPLYQNPQTGGSNWQSDIIAEIKRKEALKITKG